MKPGMPLLLSILRRDPPGEPTEQDWHTTLQLAAAESVLPWFTHLVLSAALPVPPSVSEALQQAQREAQIQAFFFTSELTGVLKSFAAAQIPVLLLKGPSLAERVYGSAPLRTSRDLDLLVRPAQFAAAQALLHTLGFIPNYYPDDYHQSLRRNTTTVELHYDVENPLSFDFHTESAWQCATLVDFHGQPAWIFAPMDELLYLCLHGTRHRFDRLSYALDIALARKHLPLPWAFRPQAVPLANLLALGGALARKLLPDGPEGPDSAALSSSQSAAILHALAQAERLWQTVLSTPAMPAKWATLQRFYLQLEPTRTHRLARRLRQLRILSTRITEPDRDFAARFGLRRSWQAQVLRPLRLLVEGALRKS